MTKLVMFDMDGTLVDSRADLTMALNRMLADDGLLPLTVEETAALLGDGRHVFVRKALDQRGGQHVEIEDAVERMGRYYDQSMVEQTALYPGMDMVLARLKDAGVKIGVITNKQHPAAQVIVRELGLLDTVDLTVGDDGVTPLKPAPDMLQNMMSNFGVSPDECWMIGDNHTDIGAAKNAGVFSCFCDYGFGVLDGVVPDARVATAAEILKVVLG